MIVAVNIRKCSDCRHKDHSGAFTEGGAKQICGHQDACSTSRAKNLGFDKYDWRARVLNNDLSIPEWCPLSKGSKY